MEFEENFKAFITFFKSEEKDKNTLEQLATALREYIDENGLLPEEMAQLIDLFCSETAYPSNMMSHLLRCCIPQRIIPDKTLKQILIRLFGNGEKLPSNVQKLLMKWLLGVTYYELASKSLLYEYFYSFFYMFLREENVEFSSRIFCNLCDKEDARPFIIDNLIVMQNKFSRKHVSDVLEFFSNGGVLQKTNILSCFTKGFQNAASRVVSEKSRIQAELLSQWKHFKPISPKGNKIRRAVPACSFLDGSKEITNFNCIVELGESDVSIPTQTMALLANPIGFHEIAFGPQNLQLRLVSNLYHTLNRVILLDLEGFSMEEKELLLQHVCDFQEYCQQPIPVVGKFLCDYLLVWDGEDFRQQIFTLLAWPVFENLELIKIMPIVLKQLFRSGDTDFKVDTIRLFRCIMKQITIYSIRAKMEIPRPFLWHHEEPNIAFKAIQWTSSFVSEAISEAFGWGDRKSILMILHESLLYYIVTQQIEQETDAPVTVEIPDSLVQYTLASCDKVCIARLCALLTRYATITKERLYRLGVYGEFDDYFNNKLSGYLMDCYNALFVGLEAITGAKTNIFNDSCIETLRSVNLPLNVNDILCIKDNFVWYDLLSENDSPSIPEEVQDLEKLVKTLLGIN